MGDKNLCQGEAMFAQQFHDLFDVPSRINAYGTLVSKISDYRTIT